MKFHRVRWMVLSAALLLTGVSLLPGQGTKGDKSDPAVERTRKLTKMLDDLYKTAIVLITEHYVKGDEPAAAVAGKLLWKAMKEKGHHEVRLVDATGDPIEAVNAPADDFEKAAIKEILGGKASVDKIVEKDGKRYLRTATIVPVVMEKCKSCHPHYANVPKGKAIGAIAYTLPIAVSSSRTVKAVRINSFSPWEKVAEGRMRDDQLLTFKRRPSLTLAFSQRESEKTPPPIPDPRPQPSLSCSAR